jgi:hypothetical protein
MLQKLYNCAAMTVALRRRHFHGDRRLTISFLDRAMSSLHLLHRFAHCQHSDDKQRHKFQLILEA